MKSPKLYFTDTGLAVFLMGFSSVDALWTSMQAGALWENHVVTQWLRWRDWHEPSLGLWYWRDQGGNEVDLLLERDLKLFAVECKLSEHSDKKAVRGIKRLKKFYGNEHIVRSYVACPVEMSFDIEPGVTAISGWKTWELT